jgi:transcriptional regulator with AAA-type ATPase domain
MARLLFYRFPAGDEVLFAARLGHSRTRIGRTDDCDVVLPDEAVSRSHCIVDATDGGFELVDRSTNGTWVNGERVQRAVLRDGDDVRIGPFLARFQLKHQVVAEDTEQSQVEARHEEVLEIGTGYAIAEAELVVVDGPGEGQRFPLRGSRISVGALGSRVQLPDPSLVRDHVRIRLYQGRTSIEPAAGAAFLGPHRLRDILPLQGGEEIRVGNTAFSVEWRTRVDAPLADRFGEMVGASDGIRRAFGVLRRMAAHHAPVLLTGESGTGKELAARAVHEASPRAGGRFVAVNCGAITASLFESELFGHEKGAFTGAGERRDGAFHRAEGGTLFLDEVGELPEEAQAKLLRALETGEVRRVGATDATFPDVRVVAATNRRLTDEVKGGKFRSDLYFRLAVLAVRLPALRERPEDIPVVAQAVARRIHPGITITPEAMESLRTYAWPGNARELRNVLTRAYVLYGPVVDAGCLVFSPFDNEIPAPGTVADRNIIEDAEREVILDALRRTGQNRAQAARQLGIARSTLLYKLRRWGLAD